MKAYLNIRGAPYPLMMITEEAMDEHLKKPMVKDIVGFPAFFTDTKRLWPNPEEGLVVEFLE